MMLAERADDIANNIASGNHHNASGGIELLTKPRRRPTTRFRLDDGTVAPSALAELEAFRDHSAAKLDAEATSFAALVEFDRSSIVALFKRLRNAKRLVVMCRRTRELREHSPKIKCTKCSKWTRLGAKS